MKHVLLALSLVSSLAFADGSFDPFNPEVREKAPCEKPEPKYPDNSAPDYEPEKPKAPPPNDYACSYDLTVAAAVRFNSRYDADQWCKSFGWEFCRVDTLNEDYDRYLAVFSRYQAFNSEGYDYPSARAAIFVAIGSFVEEAGLFRPVFRSDGRFTSCWKK